MTRRRAFAVVLLALLAVAAGLGALHVASRRNEAAPFPETLDAVQAAPASHRVVFENAVVRVLHVTLPPAGSSEPMHHHRWPSFFLAYDTGGTTAHIRYHRPDGGVVEQPSRQEPIHPGVWKASWMPPEPLHAIEVVEGEHPGPGAPPGWIRVEIKCAP